MSNIDYGTIDCKMRGNRSAKKPRKIVGYTQDEYPIVVMNGTRYYVNENGIMDRM